jgi:hypothetical protein
MARKAMRAQLGHMPEMDNVSLTVISRTGIEIQDVVGIAVILHTSVQHCMCYVVLSDILCVCAYVCGLVNTQAVITSHSPDVGYADFKRCQSQCPITPTTTIGAQSSPAAGDQVKNKFKKMEIALLSLSDSSSKCIRHGERMLNHIGTFFNLGKLVVTACCCHFKRWLYACVHTFIFI